MRNCSAASASGVSSVGAEPSSVTKSPPCCRTAVMNSQVDAMSSTKPSPNGCLPVFSLIVLQSSRKSSGLVGGTKEPSAASTPASPRMSRLTLMSSAAMSNGMACCVSPMVAAAAPASVSSGNSTP